MIRSTVTLFCLTALAIACSTNVNAKKQIKHSSNKKSVKVATNQLAPVSGFAESFLSTAPIADGTITILETGEKLKTNSRGNFSFNYPAGKPLTLIFEKEGFKTTQSGTIIVPAEGLTGPYKNISFQVPSNEVYFLFSKVIGAKVDDNQCHVTTTITAFHKTLDDVPQGEVGATITITPNVAEKPFYFGMFDFWPVKGKTNPLSHHLTAASLDGGVAFFNLPPSEKPYTLSAVKEGVKFTKAQFLCRKGMFINVSPPQGPMALKSA